VNATLSTAWGGTYVNDFVDRDRVKRVYVEGDGPFRSRPEDLYAWHVRGGGGRWCLSPPSPRRLGQGADLALALQCHLEL
jgi:multidrug efflux pump subunit AcrB